MRLRVDIYVSTAMVSRIITLISACAVILGLIAGGIWGSGDARF